jgi:hypothetical protein
MDSSCLDPKRMMYSFLDPKNTMDYALFKKVRAVFMFDTVSHKSMIESVKTLVDLRNNHDELLLPQLDVILHKGTSNLYMLDSSGYVVGLLSILGILYLNHVYPLRCFDFLLYPHVTIEFDHLSFSSQILLNTHGAGIGYCRG